MKTAKEIIDQLSKCGYTCEGGSLEMNVAFIRLKEIADSNYQPKFHINERVMYNGGLFYVRGFRTKSQSHPNGELVYELSSEWNHPSTTNKTTLSDIDEKSLMTVPEYEVIEVEKAKALLKSKGLI